MLYIIAGDIGSGKTLRVLQWMEYAHAAGRPVMTNIELVQYDPRTGRGCPFANDVMLIGTEDFPICAEKPQGKYGYQYFWEYAPKYAFIALDEGDIYFDSAQSKEQARETRIYHKQLRKMKHDVIYIVQRMQSLYVRIRDLAGTYVVAENNYRTWRPFRWLDSLLGPDRAIKLSRFIYHEFSSQEFNERNLRGRGDMPYYEAQRYFGWYETEQLLGDTAKILKVKQLLKGDGDDFPGNVSAAAG